MLSRHRLIEGISRLTLTAMIMANMLAPVGAAAAGTDGSPASPAPYGDDKDNTLPESQGLFNPEPVYYQPGGFVPPVRHPAGTTPAGQPPADSLPREDGLGWGQETSPEPDEPPSVVPEKDEIEFYVVAARPLTGADRVVDLQVTIRNNSERNYQDLTFTDYLETGFEYSPTSPTSPPTPLLEGEGSGGEGDGPVTFDAQNGTITRVIQNLAPGEEASFSYSIQLTTARHGALRGKAWLHNVNLSDGLLLNRTTPVTIGVDLPGAASASSMTVLRPGSWNGLGRVKVHVGEETVGQDSFLVLSPAAQAGRGPELQFKLDIYRTAAVSTDTKGRPEEQEVRVQQKFTGGFEEPAFLEINLDGYVDLKHVPAGQEPYVATYDEAAEVWVKVPILETDLEANSVSVGAAHFSVWGAGLGNSLPQNGANVLLFDQPYTSLFTGAARYSIPIWTPPGRAGMSPDISLSYSSGTMDGVLGDVQGSWVGAGWNMDGVEIVRKITTNENGYGYVNDFALTLNGSLYDLVLDTQHPSRYFTKNDAFLYVERHSYSLGNENPPNSAQVAPNRTGEWWEVVTKDGTRYRLGWNADSEQLALMYGYACTSGGINCTTPNGAYASLGYAGIAKDLVALRWRVDRVMDTHGNYMEYSYAEAQPNAGAQIAPFDRESYLKSIAFTGFKVPATESGTDLNPAYYVEFVHATRTGDVPTTFNIWDNLDSKLLDQIKVCYIVPGGGGVCGQSGSVVIRTYDFNYDVAAVPNANGTLRLANIQMTAGGYTDPVSGQSIPAVTAPTIQFNYQNLPNRAVSGGSDAYTYPRLVSIENGAGGKLTYAYEHDGRGTDSWYNYRVNQVRAENGIGTAALQSYAYVTPVYTGQGGNPGLGSLIGYTAVTDTQLDFNNGNAALLATKHTFGTQGLDIGRELQTEWLDGSTVLRKVNNTYVTDNSQAPFLGWNNRYLYQSLNYVRSGGSLVVTSQTKYYRDPATGNLLIQSDYLGSGLYRKTYYEYLLNPDPKVNILDKVSRVLLVTAGNQIVSDTRYHYDGLLATAPTKGELTLTQRLTGQGSQTIDTRTHYDIYGNVDHTYAYKSYGAVNSDPGGAAVESVTAYDSQTQSFPVQMTDPMGWSSSAAYIYALAAPYQTTDVNGWTTTTAYDGLGRTLSVTPPGLGQAGVVYSYPAPDASGKLTPPYSVEMQILDTIAQRYRSVWGIYDGLGRTIQTQVHDDAASQLLITDTIFNAQGQVYRQSLPYYAGGAGGNYTYTTAPQYVETAYDVLGRPVTVTQPGNIQSQTSYDGLTTTSLDPNGHKVSRTTDGLGRLTYVTEFKADQTAYASTVYSNDHADRLVQVNDAQSNVTSIQYNWLGQKTGMDDPDMGLWSYTYFPQGTIQTQTDARGCVTTFSYDNLSRITGKTFSGTTGICDNTPSASYTYDPTGMLGARSSSTVGTDTVSWSYLDYGRRVTQTRGAYSMTTVTDWLGRPMTMTYPDSDIVTYTYDSLGRPKNIKSSANANLTLAQLAYNVLGQITTQNLGNGVTITNTYRTDNNRLQTRLAEDSASTDLLSLSYTYDPAGNITGLTDGILGETHAYQYDSLNRLTSAEATNASGYAYRQQFGYDKVGNILQVDNWITSTPQGYLPADRDLAQTGANETSQTNFQPASYHLPAPQQQEEATSTPTSTPTSTETPTPSYTPSNTPTATNTPIPTNTSVASHTPTSTSTHTPTYTPDPGNPTTYGLISWWSLDDTSGNRLDSHVNGLTLTDMNTVAYASGKVGNAADFEFSNNEFFKRADNDLLSTGDIDFTMSAWIKLESLPTALGIDEAIISKIESATNREWLFMVDHPTNQAAIRLYNGSGTQIGSVNATSFGALTTGTWYYIVAWHNSVANTVSIQINNGVINSASTTGAPANTTSNFRIGAYSSPETYFFDGLIDEVNFYKRVLTANERTWLYNSGNGRSYAQVAGAPTPTLTPTITLTATKTPTASNTPTSTPDMSTSLKAYWSIDTASGTTAPDSAGAFGNSATLTNGVLIENTGASGKSLFFDGTNDYATVADHAEIKNNGSFTLSAWINPASVVTNRTQYIVQKGAGNKDYGFITVSTQGTPTPTGPVTVNADGSLAFQVGDLTPSLVAGPILPVNTWTFVTGVYDATAGELRLYLNGVLAANTNATGTVSMSTTALSFSPTSNLYHGRLDEVRFYNRALTASEIGQLFSSITPATPTATLTATPITATPTFTGTPIPAGDYPWGTGSDGDLTINTGNTYNINIQNQAGRSCADGGDAVAYNVTTLGSTAAVLSATPSAGCLSVGDEVLLINLQGSTASITSTGAYEFLRIASINGNTIAFTSQKINFYGEGYRSDYNIGTGSGQQRVMLMRVPNYNNVTVNGTLTANAWNYSKFGVLVFRANGTVSGTGTVSMDGKGNHGGLSYINEMNDGVTTPSEGIAGSNTTGAGGAGWCDPGLAGGGGYGTNGANGSSTGGAAYGGSTLSKLYFGSGGGPGGARKNPNTNEWYTCGNGANGGGAIYVIGRTVQFSGTLTTTGNSGSGNGGGGAGGSIRVEGYDVTLGTVSATGGTYNADGGYGRIAVYYQNSLTGLSSSPSAYTGLLGQAPTATPSSTPINLTSTPSPYGTGNDGNLTVASGTTFNINTQFSGPRTCADGKSYNVIEISESWAKLESSPASNCLAVADEILLVNLQGTGSTTANVGKYEFLRVGGIVGNVVYFTAPKVGFYGSGASDDSSIGVGAGQQRVMLMRVPNYNNVTVNGTLTSNAWDYYKYGVVAFRANGTVSGTGTISEDGKGYHGGPSFINESNDGVTTPAEGLGGIGTTGAGGGGWCDPGLAGGGGYGTNGANGSSTGGAAYGEPTMSKLYFGSGGGPGGARKNPYTNEWYTCGNGANGGGAIYVIGRTVQFSGTLTTTGNSGSGNGGGGAGGSIRVEGYDVTLGTLSATGGTYNAAGGFGRIAVYYANSLANSATVCAQASTYCQNTAQGPTATPTITPTSGPSQNPGTTSLVSWWTLDETSGTRRDSHSTNHLADNNTVAYASGLQGNSASFVTANQERLTIADNPGISTGNIDFTLVANVYLNNTTNTFILVDKTDMASDMEYRLVYNAAIPGFRFRAGTSGYVDSDPVSPNTWYTVIGWHDSVNDTLNIQVNNGVVKTVSYSGGVTDTAYSLSIGAYSNGTLGLDGRIDEVALYKRVLTPAERTWLYNNGAGRTYVEVVPPVNPGTTNLVSWWKLDETSGARNDSHGANHLTDNNTVGSAVGLQGNSASFISANSEYLSIADNPSLSTGDVDFSLAANIYLNSATTTVIIANKGDKANMNARDFTLYYDQPTAKFGFRVGNGTTNTAVLSSSTVSTGQWYSILAWHDSVNNTLNIQVNNGPTSTVSYSSGAMDTTYSMSVGAFADGTYALDGRVDELVLYKRVLTPAERTWLYNNGLGRTYTDVNPPPAEGWQASDYTYSTAIPHAVTSVTRASNTDTYAYDQNGNMTCRVEDGVTFKQTYNAENRISTVQKLATGTCASPGTLAAHWAFAYDGDGVRTGQLYTPYDGSGNPGTPVLTTYYFGGLYEVTGSAVRKYYALAGQTVALKDDTGLKYMLTDHLGSTLAVLSDQGAVLQQQRYLPFGQVRAISGSTSVTATDFGYTSQRNLPDMGLMDYRARFYSQSLGRFIQPDSIVPGAANPQAFNRYSYVNNSPINYNDPSGHKPCWATSKYSCNLTGTQIQGLLNGTQREQNFIRNLYWERGIRLPAPSSAFDYHSILGSGGGGGGACFGQLVTVIPSGPACTADFSSSTIGGVNLASYMVGSGGSIRAVMASLAISTEVRGANLIVFGARASRTAAGLNPYTNIISLSNASRLSSASNSMWASVGSRWTWAGIGLSAVADTMVFANGDYTPGEYSAALTVDAASGLLAAAIGGAVAGGITGTLIGATAGLGLGALPGLVLGAIIGAGVSVLTYAAINNYKPDIINATSPGFDAYYEANSSPVPWSGLLGP